MGQYWKAINPDSRQQLKPRVFDSPLKQTEHAWQYNPYCYAVCTLLASSIWQGQRVQWVGDYTSLTEQGINLYDFADDHFDDLAENTKLIELANTIDKAGDGEYADKLDSFYGEHVFVDLDARLYLDLAVYFDRETQSRATKDDPESWVEHPVPLMLAADGEGGGGDYPHREDYGYGLFSSHRVGLYTRDAIDLSVITDITEQVSFNENRPVPPAVLSIMQQLENPEISPWF